MWLGFMAINNQFKKHNFADLKLNFGLSAGCFLGTGYGIVLGFGTPFYYKIGLCNVVPSRNTFFHTGYISGCFVGLILGFSFTTGITCNLGKEENIDTFMQKSYNSIDFMNLALNKCFRNLKG